MKMELTTHLKPKLSQKALERKSNKPIMEKKRRARINHCLNQLKALILETDNERSRHSKLEKADILEMTVRYLQTLRAYHIHLQQLHAATLGSSLPIHEPSQQVIQRASQLPLMQPNLSALSPNHHVQNQPTSPQIHHHQQQAQVQAQPTSPQSHPLAHHPALFQAAHHPYWLGTALKYNFA